MQWLNTIADELITRYPDGEIVVSSGVSPSGVYHVGTLREVLTADAIMLELRHRGRDSRHIHVVDDLDVFRKVPVGIPESHSQYLGKPLCDVPSPDGEGNYADYFLDDFLEAAKTIHLDIDVMRAHEKYRSGFIAPAIEKVLGDIQAVKQVLVDVSGRELAEDWTPIQVIEDGYLKKRALVSLNTDNKTITYSDVEGNPQTANYATGEVKLDWRLDWPARWWLLGVKAEPFGRDHATKGGSYDTGSELAKRVFDMEPPIPVPYHFINRVGETKKMSKSSGTGISISDMAQVLPAEVIRYFVLRYSPDKQLFFNETDAVIKLIDEFSELLAKADKTDSEEQLIRICTAGVDSIVSRVPFSHLVASYQAALRNVDATLEVMKRTEYQQIVEEDAVLIKAELQFIDRWLDTWASDDVKFELSAAVNESEFSDQEKDLFAMLAEKVAAAPADADGAWFHEAMYACKDTLNLQPKDMFSALYRLLIGKTSGPRAGWFLSILPRDWLLARLQLQK
jgi:lysyl-tRNA synthetase class 1